MSVAQKPRQPSKTKTKPAKPKGTDPTAGRAKSTNAAAKAQAAADKAAKAKAAEEKKAEVAAEKAAKAKATEEKKAKVAAEKAAKAEAADEKKAKTAAEKAAKAVAKRTSPKPKTARRRDQTDTSPELLTLDAEAYLRETRGALKERVFLKDLRPKVGVQSEDFDQALLAMQQRGKVVLMGLDNPMERTPEVEAAAVHLAGRPRYLIYFQG
jgi:hypothetical protein